MSVASSMLRRVPLLHCPAQLNRTLTANFSRRSKGGHDVATYETHTAIPRNYGERLQLSEEFEEAADIFNEKKPSLSHEKHRKEEWHRKKVILKIIEKKYFRAPQEKNLLTWDAKEQLRYLHREFPDEWTVDRLAESFPVSREGVIRLLKSAWQPKTAKELIRHDHSVRRNWLALQAGGQAGGPLEMRYSSLLAAGKLNSAAGIPSLPAPGRTMFPPSPEDQDTVAIATQLLQSEDDLSDRPTTSSPGKGNAQQRPGAISSIVKEYCERRQLTEKKTTENNMIGTDGLKTASEENKKVLKEIAGPAVEVRTRTRGSRSRSGQTPKEGDLLGRPQKEESIRQGQSLFDDMLAADRGRLSAEEADSILQGDEQLPVDAPSHGQASFRGRSPEQTLSGRKSLRRRVVKQTAVSDLSMQDTRKIGSPEEYNTLASSGETIRQQENDDSGHVSRGKAAEEMLKHLRYDRPIIRGQDGVGQQASVENAYLYSERDGYQHPLGLRQQQQRVKVPQRSPKDNTPRVYQRGDEVYDDDGEFLYRIP